MNSRPAFRWELSFNYILKECLISKDLQIIRKKSRHYLDHIYSSCITENFKVILYYIQDLKFAKSTTYTTLQPFEKTRQYCTSLVDLNFLPKYVMCYHLIFHVPDFLTALINEINDQRQPFKTVKEKWLFCNTARWTLWLWT